MAMDEAVAHAETLRERGVDVGIDERYRVIEIRDDNGRLHDPADGAPAFQCFYSDGTPMWISHYTDGELHDLDDGTPARQGFYQDGKPEQISHYSNGRLQDPADSTPARQCFYSDGTPKWIEHYTNDELVSEESFPPPTGEA
jgi:hypothetical protein